MGWSCGRGQSPHPQPGPSSAPLFPGPSGPSLKSRPCPLASPPLTISLPIGFANMKRFSLFTLLFEGHIYPPKQNIFTSSSLPPVLPCGASSHLRVSACSWLQGWRPRWSGLASQCPSPGLPTHSGALSSLGSWPIFPQRILFGHDDFGGAETLPPEGGPAFSVPVGGGAEP